MAVKDDRHLLTRYSGESLARNDKPEDVHAHPQEAHLRLMDKHQEVEINPLSVWEAITPGDVLFLQSPKARDYVGTVESKTSDGLIIWMRDDLNARKLFHFQDCQSVRLLK